MRGVMRGCVLRSGIEAAVVLGLAIGGSPIRSPAEGLGSRTNSIESGRSQMLKKSPLGWERTLRLGR